MADVLRLDVSSDYQCFFDFSGSMGFSGSRFRKHLPPLPPKSSSDLGNKRDGFHGNKASVREPMGSATTATVSLLPGRELAPLERITPLGCRTVLGSRGPDKHLLSFRCIQSCLVSFLRWSPQRVLRLSMSMPMSSILAVMVLPV